MNLPIPTLEEKTSFYIAKLFWNKYFKVEGLHLDRIRRDEERNWEIQLTDYRDEALRDIKIFIENNKLTFPLKNVLTEKVFFLHESYHHLLLWKKTYDEYNNIDIMQEGEFYAPKFFSVNGKFYDNIWTKHLMQNQNCPIALRFNLATLYDFASDVSIIWNELLLMEDVPVERVIKAFGVCNNFRILNTLFSKLDIEFQPIEHVVLVERRSRPKYVRFLAQKGYEYAIYNLWNCMSNSQKLAMMMNDSYFEIINGEIDFPRCNISYFLYSQLSEDRKKLFFHWSLRHDTSEMWLALLLKSSGGHLHSEILDFIYKLPISMLSKLLELLSHRIKQLRLPLDAELFEIFWNKLSPNNYDEILEKGKFIIENLVKAKSFHNVGCIIKNLSLAQKQNCLLHGLYGAGINVLDLLCKEGEYDLLQKYLSFFLNDVNSRTKDYNLSKSDILLLNNFIMSANFKTWSISKLSKAEETEVKCRIEALMTSPYEHQESYKAKSPQSWSRIGIFEKYFEIKGSEITYRSSSSQKRKIEDIKPVKFQKL